MKGVSAVDIANELGMDVSTLRRHYGDKAVHKSHNVMRFGKESMIACAAQVVNMILRGVSYELDAWGEEIHSNETPPAKASDRLKAAIFVLRAQAEIRDVGQLTPDEVRDVVGESLKTMSDDELEQLIKNTQV